MKKTCLSLFIVLHFFMFPEEGRTAQRSNAAVHNDSLVSAAVNMIDPDSLESYLRQMEAMGTRFMMAGNRREIASWLADKFGSFGCTEVRLDSFQCYTNISFPYMNYDTVTWQYNVEARIEGIDFPDEEVIVMGHYDNVVQDGDPLLGAPGADDNASGTAAALETARVMMALDYQPRRTVIFLTTAAEELMHFGDAGSEHYAAEAALAGRNIVMVVNNDMIAYDDDSWALSISNHIPSQHITDLAVYIVENYTSLNVHLGPPSYQIGADLEAFLEQGYHGVYFMEKQFNPNYHSAYDLTDSCNIPYFTEAVKATCGLVMHTDLTVGIGSYASKQKNSRLYPNPASEYISVEFQPGEDKNILIIDNRGKLIMTTKSHEEQMRIDVSHLLPGVYWLHIANGEHMETLPFIKP